MSGFVLYEQRTLRPCLKQLLRLYLLLHLRVLLDLQSSPTVLPLSLSHHVETGRPHQKYIVTRTRVSRSKSPDQQTHFCVVLAPAIHFWCRRGESNSRPQCLCYEGITTISLLYDTPIYVSTRSDPPPRFKNVETIVPTRISQQQLPHQWPNCSLDSFVVSPGFQFDHGIQQQGHCNN